MGDKYGWASPPAVGRLTLPQLVMYLSDGESRPKRWSRRDILEYVKRYQTEG